MAMHGKGATFNMIVDVDLHVNDVHPRLPVFNLQPFSLPNGKAITVVSGSLDLHNQCIQELSIYMITPFTHTHTTPQTVLGKTNADQDWGCLLGEWKEQLMPAASNSLRRPKAGLWLWRGRRCTAGAAGPAGATSSRCEWTRQVLVERQAKLCGGFQPVCLL